MSPKLLSSYVFEYSSPLPLLCAALAMLLPYRLFKRVSADKITGAVVALACMVAAFGVGKFIQKSRAESFHPLLAADLTPYAHQPKATRLWTAHRQDAIKIGPASIAKPRTIIVAVNESTGDDFPSREGSSVLLRTKIANLSGAPEQWVMFGDAVTNSNCTDVSLPSIVTGTGTSESVEKLHAMPFIFDLAKARGYRTAFVTSSTLHWANFKQFFDGAAIDYLFSADKSGYPLINDLAIDDSVMFDKISAFISAANSDIFAVIYSNAMHLRYQVTSKIAIPAELTDRRSRALYILEHGYRELFDTLRKTGRLDNALIFILGDHGEFDYKLPGNSGHVRVEEYSPEILKSIYMVKLPADWPARLGRTIQANAADKLVANLDVAPTIADMLGLSLKQNLRYVGYSMLKPIPGGRISIATSTNDWRNWPRTAIAVARGHDRLVCNVRHSCIFRQNPAFAGEHDRQRGSRAVENALMRIVLSDPILERNVSQIVRQHYGLGY